MMHTKALSLVYPCTDVKRFLVPPEFVDWKVPFPEYKPVDYTSEKILQWPPYADPEIRWEYLQCVFPLNSHTSPTEGIFCKNTPPLWNFQLNSILLSSNFLLVFEIPPPHPVGIFNPFCGWSMDMEPCNVNRSGHYMLYQGQKACVDMPYRT